MRILFITPYPFDEAPSQRFRFEQYLIILKNNGFEFCLHSFTSLKAWKILYKPGNTLEKVLLVLSGYLKRVLLLFKIHQFDFIFIHREASPFGPPIFEWVIAKFLKKRIIYDFDDAIWSTDKLKESKFERIIMYRKNVEKICKWSYKIICVNT
jgi:hypothetical protein